MKTEYDFAKGERGKFFKQGANHYLPVYLNKEVQSYLQKHAKSKGVELASLVNELLRQDIKLIKVISP